MREILSISGAIPSSRCDCWQFRGEVGGILFTKEFSRRMAKQRSSLFFGDFSFYLLKELGIFHYAGLYR